MKKQLNAANLQKIDEVNLFQEMAEQFRRNKNANAAYVEEVHKQYVEFDSRFYGGAKKIELGDLLFLTYSRSEKKLKLCVMQVKYRRKPYENNSGNNMQYDKPLSCIGNIFQWELLHKRPDVVNRSKTNIPPYILNFRKDYKSITAYGVFYMEKGTDEIDFWYAVPELFGPKEDMFPPVKNGAKTFYSFRTKDKLEAAKYMIFNNINAKDETLLADNMDKFEQEIFSWKIGAPIDDIPEMKAYILGLLDAMKEDAENPEVIEEILRHYNSGTDSYDSQIEDRNSYRKYSGHGKGHPAAMIVITGVDKNNEQISPSDCQNPEE